MVSVRGILGFALIFGASMLNISAQAQIIPLSDPKTSEYVYEDVSHAKISQMYWALGKFDLQNDENIDNFMRVNECYIYKQFIHNEFEWQKIREQARKYIKNNFKFFPIRFSVEQKIKMSEYNFEDQSFDIWVPYQIDNVKHFEVKTKEFGERVCGGDMMEYSVDGYPQIVVMELTRPLSVYSFKVPSDIAQAYILKKEAEVPKNQDVTTKEDLYNTRDAYLVMNVRFFNYRGEVDNHNRFENAAQVFAKIEQINVYADPDHRFLLYSEDRIVDGEADLAEKMLKERLDKLRGEGGDKDDDGEIKVPDILNLPE